jgi:16S rRNA (guanine527-N7)-methyltransferase
MGRPDDKLREIRIRPWGMPLRSIRATSGNRCDNPFLRNLSPMSRIEGTAPDLSRDRENALAMFDVSRETVSRLDRFVELLLAWQSKVNLISPSTVPSLWTRHVADSLQLLHLVGLPPSAAGSSSPGLSRRSRSGGHGGNCRDDRDEPRHDRAGRPGEGREEGGVWFDLGSGGGFPGIVIACALADIPGTRVHLVESNMKKASFLREAVRETKVPAIVHAARIEALSSTFAGTVDYVTARALAPLPELLEWIAPFMKRGAKALLLKGQDLDNELTKATKNWNIEADIVPSKTSRAGRILIVRGLSRRLPHAPLPRAPQG